MADHPFHGKWSSYGLNDGGDTFNDGEINLVITPSGAFSGTHKPRLSSGGLGNPVTLQLVDLTNTDIHFKELDSEKCDYHGRLLQDPFQGNRKIIIGGYTIPRRFNSANPLGSEGRRSSDLPAPGQDNGTWVATQP